MKGDRQSPFIASSAQNTANRGRGNNLSISLIPVIATVRDPEDAPIGVSHQMTSRLRAHSKWSPSP
jgi:hypothetical protein